MDKYKRKLLKGEYYDYGYCTKCEDETEHIYFYSEHERDSSQNYKICLNCKNEE